MGPGAVLAVRTYDRHSEALVDEQQLGASGWWVAGVDWNPVVACVDQSEVVVGGFGCHLSSR